jgi:gliding motility-associated-like protein
MRLSLIITLIFTNFLFSQLSKKHWLPPLHSRDATAVNDHYLYLSTPEPTPFTVKVTTGNGTPIQGSPFTISQGNPQTISIGNTQPSNMFLSLTNVNVVRSNYGLIAEGSKDFYATFKVRSQNHAEILVSKGIPGIGTNFRVGSVPQYYDSPIRNFVSSFMATEDGTVVNVSDYDTNVVFASGTGNVTTNSQTFSLNKGQSVVLSGYTDNPGNLTGFIGALISSNKPIAVSTGNALGGTELSPVNGSKQDFNLDQIVSYDQIGTEYIVVKGNGSNNSELPLVIATQDNTQVFVNGNATPITTLNSGDYFLIPSNNYQGTSNKNMYITSSSPIYLYQILAGSTSDATTGLNFIPPLSCFFQKSVDLIPSINTIGNTTYATDILALTHTNSVVSINGTVTTATPQTVLGTSEWVTYRISGYSGNVVVDSTGPLAVGIFGTDGNAVGFSGYYSGFGSEPRDTDVTICSDGTTNLLDEIDGNPETGGTWSPALSSGTDIFDPNVDLAGTYNYSYTGDCANVSVDITVTIQQAPVAGVDNTITVCSTDAIVDLFSLLGPNAIPNGTWSYLFGSHSQFYDPAQDPAGEYVYTIESDGICDEVSAKITVIKNPSPIINSISDYIICDDNLDGDDTNGFATFNLNTKTTEIQNGQTDITVTYHSNQADAEANLNPQTNYYSNSQLVYVRLTNNTTGCYSTTSFDLIVNSLPVVNNNVDLKQCDTDTDAITDFNLTFANLLISNDPTLSYSYFTTAINAENNNLPITNFESYTATNNSVIWSRVVNQNGCYRVVKVNLIVSTTTPISVIEILECDVLINTNDPSNDGFDYFDLNIATASILGQFPPNQNLQVSYYANESDATAGINSINTSVDYRNTFANIQFLWVRIDSAINRECFGLGQYVKLIVNPIPNFDLGIDKTLCVDPTTGLVSYSLNATPISSGNYTYSWTPANPTLDSSGNQSAIYIISQEGTYSVTVTNTVTTCTNTDEVTIAYSSEPVSVTGTLITPFFSTGLASIEAFPVGGFGVYEYSIDNGVNWQNSPVFSGLVNGTYTILVRDTNKCGILETQEITTITYPAYFTPNGDGYNEYWNINGLLQSYQAKIYIFDRYGKFLKELKPNAGGWDGTYNGTALPSTDYWFKIEYTENNIRKEFKSHFSLKR